MTYLITKYSNVVTQKDMLFLTERANFYVKSVNTK